MAAHKARPTWAMCSTSFSTVGFSGGVMLTPLLPCEHPAGAGNRTRQTGWGEDSGAARSLHTPRTAVHGLSTGWSWDGDTRDVRM
ncbi:hypothetical protein StrepF001_23425 [Streptomyces sp. F001]|nr:hypothetical protein StrepF001_23425 [Streptomyces sp. F001]